MNVYEPGSTVRLTVSIADAAGDPVDPNAVKWQAIDATGKASTETDGTKDSIGNYHGDLDVPDETTSAGYWRIRWRTEGPDAAVERTFRVAASPFAAAPV